MLAAVLTIGAAALCGADLWCKAYVEKHFRSDEEREIGNGNIVLRKVHNKGMACNIGDSRPQAVRIVSGIICGVMSVYYVILLMKSRNLFKKKGMALILAGTVSNCYDRFVRKYVVDYFGFKTKWKKLSEITFNLGDMFLFLGSFLYLIAELFSKKK